MSEPEEIMMTLEDEIAFINFQNEAEHNIMVHFLIAQNIKMVHMPIHIG